MSGILQRKLRRDIGRQRAQYIAVTVTVFLGVLLFGTTWDAFRNLELSYDSAFERYRFANVTVSGGDVAAAARETRRLDGVESVTTRTQADVPFRIGEDKLLGRIVGMPPDHRPEVNDVEVVEGEYLQPGSSTRVLADQHLVDDFDLEVGDSFAIRGPGGAKEVTIAGIAASPEYFWPARSRQELLSAPKDFGVAYVSSSLADELSDDGPNQMLAYFEGGAEMAPLEERIEEIGASAGATHVFPRAEQPSNSALEEDLKGFRELAVLFPLLFLTAAAMASSVLITRLVNAQRPVIGMLRASGYGRRAILLHYGSFGLVAGLAGAIPAAIAAELLAAQVTDLYTTQLSIPLTITELDPLTPAIGIGFGLIAGSIAAGAPALAASRTPPGEAMRRIPPIGGGRPSLAERALPPLRRIPARWKMSLRAIGRNPRRSLYTAMGVVLSLTLVLVSWGMIDTTTILLDRQFQTIQRQDAEVRFGAPLRPSRLERLRAVEGVARVEGGAELPISIRGPDGRYQTALVALEPRTAMHTFIGEDGEELGLPSSAILAGKSLPDVTGAGPGDTVEIGVVGDERSFEVRVEALVDEPFGTYTYAALSSLQAIDPKAIGEGNVALIRYEEGVDRDRMRDRLSSIGGVVAFEDSQALYEMVQDYLALYYAFVGVMLLFGASMAFALMFATMSSNIAERRIEFATLRAAGLGHKSLARMVRTENVIVTLAGIGPGLALGYLVGAAYMASFSSDQFDFGLEVRTTTFIFCAVAIFAVALLSQIPSLRAMRRLDIAGIVRERAA